VDDLAPETFAFRDLTLDQFVAQLSSSDPVPGGGSASAVAASLAASLVAMVASLSVDRPKYAAHAALHEHASESGRLLAARLLDLAADDAAAYGAFADALKLPRETEDERAARTSAIRSAARRASEVPLACVEACLEVVATAETLAGRSNVNAASDLVVSAFLAEAAAQGAAQNVFVNLPSIGDETFSRETTSRTNDVLQEIARLAEATRTQVLSGDPRDPVPSVVPGQGR